MLEGGRAPTHSFPKQDEEYHMLKAINTKILFAILATLTAIGGLLVHQNHVNAAAAAKSAAILEQQQKATEQQKKHDEEFWKEVEANKKRHSSAIGGGSDTNKFIP